MWAASVAQGANEPEAQRALGSTPAEQDSAGPEQAEGGGGGFWHWGEGGPKAIGLVGSHGSDAGGKVGPADKERVVTRGQRERASHPAIGQSIAEDA